MSKFPVFMKAMVFIASCLMISGAFAQEKTLAVVDEKPLMLSDISPTKAELTETAEAMSVSRQLALSRIRHNRFAEQLIDRIMDTYAAQQKIEPDEALVKAFSSRFGDQVDGSEENSRPVKDIAREQARIWQIEKALYEAFGGTVIFTQQNPQYPIEAYRKLLSQYEEQGLLVFKSKEYESVLKRIFAPPYEMKIAPEHVSFVKPWWSTGQVIGSASSTAAKSDVEK